MNNRISSIFVRPRPVEQLTPEQKANLEKRRAEVRAAERKNSIQAKPRKTQAGREKGYDPAYLEEALNLGKEIQCPELVIVALIRNRFWWNVGQGKPDNFIELGNVTLARYGVSKFQKLRILKAMEQAGWIRLAPAERKSSRIKLLRML